MPRQKRNYRDVTRDEFLARISYDPETGVFSRAKPVHGGAASEDIGNVDAWGYARISSCSTTVKGHRLAWFLHYGEWPPVGIDIDHINGVRTDNRISNLRLASRSENLANKHMQKPNRWGVRGVEFLPSTSKWRARITFRRKRFHLGCFASIEEAQEAVRHGVIAIHGDFARV